MWGGGGKVGTFYIPGTVYSFNECSSSIIIFLNYVLTEYTISFKVHNKPVRFHYPHLTNEKNKAKGGKILLKVTQVARQDSNPDLSKIFPMSGVSNLLPRSLLL